MTNRISPWKRIFTGHSTGNTAWLAMLRIGTSLAMICKILSEWPFLDELYSSHGIVPRDVAPMFLHRAVYGIGFFIAPLLRRLTETQAIHLFFGLLLVLSCLLLLGLFTRISAILCWLMMLLVLNGTYITSYGIDYILLSLLFYTAVFPSGASYSADSRFRCAYPSPDLKSIRLYHLIFQLHVCIIYLVTGYYKTTGELWQDGTAISQSLIHAPSYTIFTFAALRIPQLPWLIRTLSYITVGCELFYPFAIWIRQFSLFIFVIILLIHIAVAVCLGLWIFSFVMIVLNLAAFGHLLIPSKIIDLQ